jgi:hypothetical protein
MREKAGKSGRAAESMLRAGEILRNKKKEETQ